MTKTSKSEKLIEALESAGYSPRAYSGRGMYGDECVTVSGNIGERELGIQIGEGFGPYRTDSLGKGIAVYWPSHKWPEGRDD